MELNKKNTKKLKPSSIKMLLGLFCLLNFTQAKVIGQYNVDSIKKEISLATGNDSLQIELYLKLCFEYTHKNGGTETLGFLDSIFKLSDGKNYNQLMLANNLMGYIKNYQEKYAEAILYYEKGIEFGEKGLKTTDKKRANKIEKFITQISDNIANVHQHKGELEKAIEIRLNSLKKLEKLDDSVGMIISYCNIGCTYIMIKDLQKGINYLNKSRALSENSKYKFILPNVYGNMGLGYTRLNQKDSALVYYIKCREVINKKRQPRGYYNNEANIASLYLSIKDTTRSNESFEKIFSEFDDTSENQIYYWKLLYAESLNKQGKHEKANEVFSNVKGNIAITRPVVKKLYGEVGYKVNLQNKDYKNALSFMELYHSAKDSIYNLKSDSSFKAIEGVYDVAKKQEVIDKQKIELKNKTIFVGGLIAALVLFALFFNSFRNKKRYQSKIAEEKQKATDIEIESLKKENKIISMQSMLEGQEEERKRIAQDLHDNIGTLMTSIKLKFLSIQKEMEEFQKMNLSGELDNMINNASQEVRRISHRMTPRVLELTGLVGAISELEQQLLAEQIEFSANNSALEDIEDNNFSINVYRIIQEIFNNIVKHSKATKVSMSSEISDNKLIMRIRDNGIGISDKKWNDNLSVGLSGVKSRIEYLDGKIKLIEDEGTHYKISIPLK